MNCIKHAKASKIDVELTFDNQYFELKISDNGIGFDMKDPNFKKGVGISSMQERAELLKGQIMIDTQMGKGTKIIFSSKQFLHQPDGLYSL